MDSRFQYTPAANTYPMAESDEKGVPASTVISVPSYSPQTRDHILWSLFNTIYCNFCCLGFLALVFSVKARDRKVVGDMNGATSYGSTAKWLNIASVVLSVVAFIVIIILVATGVIGAARFMNENDDIWRHRNGK